MIVKKIEIENYRSIEKIAVEVVEISERKCNIYLGINESGKSNILKAISLLDSQQKVDYDLDCNKAAKKDGENIEIIYHLKITNPRFYKSQFVKGGVEKGLAGLIDIKKIQRKVVIRKGNSRSDLFHIRIKNNKKFLQYAISPDEKDIHKISDIYTGEEKVTGESIDQLIGTNYKLLDKDSLESFLEKNFFSLFEANTPKIIYWEPTDRYLINNPVNLNQFKEDINSSLPLRNIFRIAGIKEIKNRIELILNNTEERSQLEEELSEKITAYINSVWKEHAINIKLRIEEPLSCTVMVEDKDNTMPKYNMNQRSDGFKQFISILLNLSAENESDVLKNKIILLDEPEVHLHPSGVRYLRDELLKISKNNIVLIATHSIYMVDRLNLGRHYSVCKETSVTTLINIQKNNPYQEEVIYEALGTSIYEHIYPNMVVFEGRIDKDIFDAFTNKFKSEFRPLSMGTISADGVEKVPIYTKFFDGKSVKGFVVLDSDKDGQKIKQMIIKNSSAYNSKNTFEINDINDKKIKATVEDLFPNEVITKCIMTRYKLDMELDNGKPKIEQIKRKLKDNRTIGPNDKLAELKSDIIHLILKDVGKYSKDKLKEKYQIYFSFVEGLHNKMKSIKK